MPDIQSILSHLHPTQAAIGAVVAQIVAAVVSFGLINTSEAEIILNAAAALISTAFVIANSVHHLASAKVAAAKIAAGSK